MTAGLAGWITAGWTISFVGVLIRDRVRQRELIARAAHELRGPLQTLSLGIHRWDRDGSDLPRGALELEVARARLALDDLQSRRASRWRAREYRRDESAGPIDIRELVADAASVARARGATIDVRGPRSAAPVVILGARVRLLQALANLIVNAIEHGASPISLSWTAGPCSARIEVGDRGVGLPASLDVLTRRARAGRGRRGRGLAVAADIARAHGGQLLAAPASRGAVLVLELPMPAPAQRVSRAGLIRERFATTGALWRSG